MPPTLTYHILFTLVEIQVIPEPLLTTLIFSASSQKTISGNITATISDHQPEFLISPNTLADSPSKKSNVFERDCLENFVLNYFVVDWPKILELDEKNVNSATNNFLDAINSALNKYAPL